MRSSYDGLGLANGWIMLLMVLLFCFTSLGNCAKDQSNNKSDDCASAAGPYCQRCGPQGCIKCRNFIVHSTRQCVTQCPSGYGPRWSIMVDYMGKMCVRSNSNFLGLGPRSTAILTGILAGTVLCLIVIASTVIYLRYKRNKTSSPHQSIGEAGSDLAPDDVTAAQNTAIFLKQLDTLRPYAYTYLRMLNDTRRQIRELHRMGADNSAICAYRPVVRDLAKILILLNMNESGNKCAGAVLPPDDWDHLYGWAEQALKRYKRMSSGEFLSTSHNYSSASGGSNAQVTQLIDFLQLQPEYQASTLSTQIQNGDDLELRGSTSTMMSTFKPDHQAIFSTLDVPKKPVITNDYLTTLPLPAPLNPLLQWKFNECDLRDNDSDNNKGQHRNDNHKNIDIMSEFNPQQLWKNPSKESLNNPSLYFLDDDFCQLGFRPQDEITTEL